MRVTKRKLEICLKVTKVVTRIIVVTREAETEEKLVFAEQV